MAKTVSAKGHVKKTSKVGKHLPKLVSAKKEELDSPEPLSIKEREEVKLVSQLMSPEKRMCLIPKVTLMFAAVLTSAHNIHSESILISESKGNLSERQVVVAVGPGSLLKVGDWVKVNVDMFPKETKPGKHDMGNEIIIHPPIERIGNTSYFLLTDRHIKYIINRD